MSDEQENTGPRYPECNVELAGTSANAASVISKVRRGLEKYLRDQEYTADQVTKIVEEFTEEATSGDYDNVLTTAFRWVSVS